MINCFIFSFFSSSEKPKFEPDPDFINRLIPFSRDSRHASIQFSSIIISYCRSKSFESITTKKSYWITGTCTLTVASSFFCIFDASFLSLKIGRPPFQSEQIPKAGCMRMLSRHIHLRWLDKIMNFRPTSAQTSGDFFWNHLASHLFIRLHLEV